MFKFLVIGDLHYRGNNPRARTDDYPGAMRRKLVEVLSIAEARQVDCVVQLGDLFDSPTVSLASVAEIASLVKDSEIPILGIAGNHDLFGANLASINRTPYGFMVNMGYIQDLHRHFHMADDLCFTGHAYDTDTDRDIEQYLTPKSVVDTFDLNIRVVHGMILDKRPSFDMRHTLISEIAMQERCPDILLTGHYHTGFRAIKVEAANKHGKMLAVNPGALCRLSAHAGELERRVEVCLVTITTGFLIIVEMIPLESARPGREVLSREHLEAQAERESQIAEFLGLLAEEGEVRLLETREIIQEIANREKLPKGVIDEALKRLGGMGVLGSNAN